VSDRGSILPLIAGLLALSLTAVLAVSAVTSLSIERHRLVALAESTALAAADNFDPSRLTRDGAGVRAPLTDNLVRAAAVEYLSGVHGSFDSLRLLSAGSPDGRRARIVLSATWKTPIVSQFVSVSVPLRAEAWARSVIR
jgi:inner membrane protein involved in colicin E2 resistance